MTAGRADRPATPEPQYRAALRWYPRGWRRRNEEVMVGTLLDVADADGRTTASRDELRDLRRSGLAARADALLPGAIRDRVAAISLGAGTAISLALLTAQAWAPFSDVPASLPGLPGFYGDRGMPDHVIWQLLIHPGLWIAAALATFAGVTWLARILLVASIPASIIGIVLTDGPDDLRPSFFLLVTLAVLALMTCTGRAPRRWLLIATAISVAGVASWLAFSQPFGERYFPRGGLVDLIASPWPTLVLLAAGVVLAIRGRRLALAALLVAAIPWLVLLLGDLIWFNVSDFGWPGVYVVSTIVVVAVPVLILVAVRFVPRHREPVSPVG